MKPTQVLQEIRKMRFEEAYEGWNAGRRLSPEPARSLSTLKASTGKEHRKERASRQAAAKNHRCTARVDVKRVGPAPGEPD